MAHMIDTSNARNNIAYVGETPWHNLGKIKLATDSFATWAADAGLAHKVMDAPVLFAVGDEGNDVRRFTGKRVLYRSDTLAPLSVVSKDYKIVQPATVLAFFEALCQHNGFTMEVAGSLDGGKRIWALAKVNDGAPVIGHDLVKPYVLLATSYDGTMATIAKLTSIRVVCWNTLSFALSEADAEQREAAKKGSASSVVRVSHSADFDPEEARLDLGIAFNSFEKFLIDTRKLAKLQVNKAFCVEFLKELLPQPVSVTTAKDGAKIVQPGNIEDSRGFRQIMDLFRGEAMGANLPEANGTAFGLLNAVTQHVDWQRGRTDNSRMSSAWFGQGNALKDNAFKLLMQVVA